MICLQGGGEFSPGCRDMDRALLEHVDGAIVVTALAGARGEDYRKATENGVRHFRDLGGEVVLAAPDAREHPEEALEAISSAHLVVLPGGSPARLLEALTTTRVSGALRALLDTGGSVMGASAGAMVLGPWTLLPDRGAGMVVPGLGLSPVAVVPHWHRGGRPDWVRALREAGGPALPIVGLPEESGVLIMDDALTAVGREPTRVISDERDLQPAERWQLP